ncbi:Cystathionine gamma-synthase, converts cysteine into cystathionine [Moelleriella libera RCEF 2490]|uniref:Cystathionine gamma-synthase, converts cysteine into cystathionine n=1 Tax=Moelleriella libera RCEF 2490 TaxID=1081109 RepID=A0A167Y4D2_9HYPO|nr:Cystathionine gamma-synthase, converts cysteine into cystathionine [Moelleriella libera RCEF 2490]
MSATITTSFGQAVPPAPRHAVTVHKGAVWENAVKFGAGVPSVIAKFYDVYPRICPRTRPHRDILGDAVLRHVDQSGAACLLFLSLQPAKQGVEYAISTRRGDGVDTRQLRAEALDIRAFVAKDPFLLSFSLQKSLVSWVCASGGPTGGRLRRAGLAALERGPARTSNTIQHQTHD